MTEIGKLINERKESLGLTQSNVAARLRISEGHLSRIIRGHQRIMPDVAAKMAKAGLGSIDDILAIQARADSKTAGKVSTAGVQKDCLKGV